MRELFKNTADEIRLFMVSSSDHIAPLTGATVAVSLLKKGQTAFAAGAGTVTEAGGGWYIYYATAADTDTYGPLAVRAVAIGADPFNTEYQVKYNNPYAKLTVAADELAAALNLTSPMIASVAAATQTGLTEQGYTTVRATNLDRLTAMFGNVVGYLNEMIDATTVDYARFTANALETSPVADTSGLATATALATVDSIVDSILVDTSTTLPAQITALNDITAQEVWEYVTRTLTSSGSGGATAQEVWEYATRALTDKTDFVLSSAGVSAVQSGLATASALSAVDTVVDAIKVSTDKFETMIVLDGAAYQYTTNSLENAPSGSGATPAEIDAYLTDRHGSGSWQTGGTDAVQSVNVIQINGSETAAVNMSKTALTIATGTVQAGSTNTSIITDLTETNTDNFVNKLFTVVDGVNAKESSLITEYDGATKTLTLEGLTRVPTIGAEFTIQ